MVFKIKVLLNFAVFVFICAQVNATDGDSLFVNYDSLELSIHNNLKSEGLSFEAFTNAFYGYQKPLKENRISKIYPYKN